MSQKDGFASALMAPSAGTRASAWNRRGHPSDNGEYAMYGLGGLIGGLIGHAHGSPLDLYPNPETRQPPFQPGLPTGGGGGGEDFAEKLASEKTSSAQKDRPE